MSKQPLPPTLADIARKKNISPSTLYNVWRRNGTLPAYKWEKVIEALKEAQDYYPDMIAWAEEQKAFMEKVIRN